MKRKQAAAGSLKRSALLIVMIVLGIVIAVFIPWNALTLSSHPHPVQNYEEANRQI